MLKPQATVWGFVLSGYKIRNVSAKNIWGISDTHAPANVHVAHPPAITPARHASAALA